MKWTTDKPTNNGFYWVRASTGDVDVVQIYGCNFREPRVQYHGLRETDRLQDINGEWFGPLKVPA